MMRAVLPTIMQNYLHEEWMRVVGHNVVPVFKAVIVGRETWHAIFCSDVPSTIVLCAIGGIHASGLAFIFFTLGIIHMHTQTGTYEYLTVFTLIGKGKFSVRAVAGSDTDSITSSQSNKSHEPSPTSNRKLLGISSCDELNTNDNGKW